MNRLVLSKGNPFSKLVVIGEAPGAIEQKTGLPFVGRSGRLLSKMLLDCGINPDKDAYFCNVIKFRPPANRKPSADEIELSKPWLFQQINIIKPEILLLVGSTALKVFTGINSGISIHRGKWIKKNRIIMMPIFHPSYLLRFSPEKENGPYQLTLNDLLNLKQKLSLF